MKMRQLIFLLILAVAVISRPVSTLAQGNEYAVRYRGGTLATKVKSKDWGNTLTLTSDKIVLEMKDEQTLTIDPKKVSALSYGKEANKRVKTYAGVAVIVPFFLVKISPKDTKHLVSIEYKGEDGKGAALLLQAKEDQYRALLTSLRAITGKEVQPEEKQGKR